MGLLRKLLGVDALSNKLGDEWPELQKQWAGRQVEMPKEADQVNKIGKMGIFSKWRNPDAYAVTGPFGTINLNRDLIEKDKQDLGDVLVHELTHVGQGKQGFLRKIYNPSAVENEAVNAEAMRKVRKEDIPLRSKLFDANRKIPVVKVDQ